MCKSVTRGTVYPGSSEQRPRDGILDGSPFPTSANKNFKMLVLKSGTLGARHGGGISEGLSSLRCREMTG